jgi:hypothetical protein
MLHSVKPAALALLLMLLGSGSAAVAQEYVKANGLLSDDDFYRLVACAAPPGGACQKPLVRWSKRDAKDVSVQIVKIEEGYPAKVAAKIEAGLDATIAELNGVGAKLRVSRAEPGKKADIRIFLLNIPRDSEISGTGLFWFDGVFMELARMQMEWRDNRTVVQCAIAYSRDVKTSEVQRLLIEEITQCMGLLTDIGGRTYEGRSIFSETSTARSKLGEQDAMALRRHYP